MHGTPGHCAARLAGPGYIMPLRNELARSCAQVPAHDLPLHTCLPQHVATHTWHWMFARLHHAAEERVGVGHGPHVGVRHRREGGEVGHLWWKGWRAEVGGARAGGSDVSCCVLATPAGAVRSVVQRCTQWSEHRRQETAPPAVQVAVLKPRVNPRTYRSSVPYTSTLVLCTCGDGPYQRQPAQVVTACYHTHAPCLSR